MSNRSIRKIVHTSVSSTTALLRLSRYMSILSNLWLGELLKWGLPRWGIAAMVTLCLMLMHITIGKLDSPGDWLWHLTDSIYLGLFTWLLLFCATRTDDDLQASTLLISDKNWAQRGLSIKDARIETAFSLFVGSCIAGFAWFIEVVDADIFIDRAPGERAAIFIRWIFDSALFIHLISMVLRHRRWLQRYINNNLKINLLHIDELSVLSSGFITWIAVEACVIALYVLSFAFLKDPNPYELLRIFADTGIIAIIVLLLFTPILQTRAKVMKAITSMRFGIGHFAAILPDSVFMRLFRPSHGFCLPWWKSYSTGSLRNDRGLMWTTVSCKQWRAKAVDFWARPLAENSDVG
jgi:hypothetical protein